MKLWTTLVEVKTRDQFVLFFLLDWGLYYRYKLYVRSILDQTATCTIDIRWISSCACHCTRHCCSLVTTSGTHKLWVPTRVVARLGYLQSSVCARTVVGANGSDPRDWILDWIQTTNYEWWMWIVWPLSDDHLNYFIITWLSLITMVTPL